MLDDGQLGWLCMVDGVLFSSCVLLSVVLLLPYLVLRPLWNVPRSFEFVLLSRVWEKNYRAIQGSMMEGQPGQWYHARQRDNYWVLEAELRSGLLW